MTFLELKNFLENQQQLLEKHYPIPDKEKAIFARLVKITEELGELSEAVLSYFSLQRKDKEKLDKEALAGEIADVLIGTMLLANQLEIDIEEALNNKIKKINERDYTKS